MQLSVRDHDAFSNDKTLKEIQIWHAKFVLLIIINILKFTRQPGGQSDIV